MAENYAFRTIQIAPRQWPKVARAVHGTAAAAMRRDGGALWGLFTPLIGLRSDQGIVISAWPETATPAAADAALGAIPDVLSVAGEDLQPTVRPKMAAPPHGPGIYSFRWFNLRAADWPELVDLSSAAWETFEQAFGASILGLWLSRAVTPPAARGLLLTRYADHAAWDRSRPDGPAPGDPESARRFMRRRELVESTICMTTKLVEAD
ncbi:MAG TPA: hypothetical protein VMU42_10670 [Candidatus Sulfotelmatobacter sp.]|nr:hypothetical protein [Candidatus Sulfotelmatobacter sp.]